MSRIIRKIELPRPTQEARSTHRLPFGARPIHVDGMMGRLVVWMECDSEAEEVGFVFIVLVHGAEIPPGAQHVGSVVLGDRYDWHVYMGRK